MMLEVQRGFITSTTTTLDYVQRVTGRPNLLTFLTMKPKSAIVRVVYSIFEICAPLEITTDDLDDEFLFF